MGTRILTQSDIKRLLSPIECAQLMRTAFLAEAQGAALQPIRQCMELPGGKGLLSLMPGAIASAGYFGIKVVTVFPENAGTVHGSHQGAVLHFNAETGALEGIVDGRALTALRTAAATAVATELLARPDSACLTIFGNGDEAEFHLHSLLAVRPFERVIVCGRSLDRVKAFAKRLEPELGREMEYSSDIPVCAALADVIVTATSAHRPFLMQEHVRPGTHVNLVGSSVPEHYEAAAELLAVARIFSDYTPSALALGGEIRRAIQNGFITPDHIVGSVGDVLSHKVTGRRSDHEITLFKSLGMIAEDLVAVSALLDRARERNMGLEVEF